MAIPLKDGAGGTTGFGRESPNGHRGLSEGFLDHKTLRRQAARRIEKTLILFQVALIAVAPFVVPGVGDPTLQIGYFLLQFRLGPLVSEVLGICDCCSKGLSHKTRTFPR